MQYVFTSLGGSGSLHLRAKLKQAGYNVAWSPTGVWQTYRTDAQNRLIVDRSYVDAIYSKPPTKREMKKFHQLIGQAIGFRMSPHLTIDQNIKNYIDVLQSTHTFTAIFRPSSCIFSRNKIKDVVFNIRHPMHAYLSLVKPRRHPHYADRFGGKNTLDAMHFAGAMFNCVVKEYLDCKQAGLNPVLIRYEYADQDCLVSDKLVSLYQGWTTKKRNVGLTQECEQALKDVVAPYYYQLYERWDI